MSTNEVSCRLLHEGQIQRLMHVPEIGAIKGGPFTAIQDAVFIELAAGGIASVKLVGNQRGRSNGDIFRKPGIESPNPFARGPVPLDPEACHLPECMDA